MASDQGRAQSSFAGRDLRSHRFNIFTLQKRRLEPREVKRLALGHTASSGYDFEHYPSLNKLCEKHKFSRANIRPEGKCLQMPDIIGLGVDAC